MKQILKRLEKLEKEVIELKKNKEDKKVYGQSKGKSIHKEDLLSCPKCGKNMFNCEC